MRLTKFPQSFFVIAGPCVLEDSDLNLNVANHLSLWSHRTGIPVIFKASFDKANRSNYYSARGPGLEEGLCLLEQVRDETGLPLLTDVHEVAQVRAAATVVDVLQVPAFLCRQTDLIQACAGTGRLLNLKKGQWMSPSDMRMAFIKAQATALATAAIAVTERGTVHGYGDLVVDFRSLVEMATFGGTVVYDATHSVQRPGMGEDGTSGGDTRLVGPLARAAAAVGIDGLFLEVHPEPHEAPSDGDSMVRLDHFADLMDEVLRVVEATA